MPNTLNSNDDFLSLISTPDFDSDIYDLSVKIESKVSKKAIDRLRELYEDDINKFQMIQEILHRQHMIASRIKIPAFLIALKNTALNIKKYIPGSKTTIDVSILDTLETEKKKLTDSIAEYIVSSQYTTDVITLILEEFQQAYEASLKLFDETYFISDSVIKKIWQKGKNGDRIIQTAVDAYLAKVLHKYSSAFDTLKKQTKAKIAVFTPDEKKINSRFLIQSAILIPVNHWVGNSTVNQKTWEALQKLERISARVQTILHEPKKIQFGELETHARSVFIQENDSIEVRNLKNAIREKLTAIEILHQEKTPEIIPKINFEIPQIDITPDVPVVSKLIPEQTQILEEIRLLKQHVGNPSSTRVTNVNSFGDGHFWFNILNPFLNFVSDYITKNPDQAKSFSWQKIAQAYAMTFINEPKLRAWCATLSEETKASENFIIEWKKLPNFVKEQSKQGEFKKKVGKDPLKVLCGLLAWYFEGKVVK